MEIVKCRVELKKPEKASKSKDNCFVWQKLAKILVRVLARNPMIKDKSNAEKTRSV